MIGRLKPPTYREWLERRCIADFAVLHRRGYFLPQLRKSWRQRQRDYECFALDREVFSKFAAMSEKELIALAIPHYPEWSTTVTVSNEIAAKSHHDKVLSEPGAFKLPIKDIGIGILCDLLADPSVPTHELELLRAEKERRDEEQRRIADELPF
jgi:hypothetical protein